MNEPLISVYFIVRAYITQPNGERHQHDQQIHKVCKRSEIERRDYQNYVAWGLYVDFKHTDNIVEAVQVLWADGPGNERFILNGYFLPGDLDPEWRAA